MRQQSIVPLGIVGAIAVLALSLVLGNQSTTTTISPTPNSKLSVTTSDSEIGASGEATQYRPDGRTTTSLEAEVSEYGGKVRLTQEQEFRVPDFDGAINDAEQAFSNGAKTAEQLLDEAESIVGH